MGDDADSNYLIVRDCKERILSQDVWEDSDDYGLFHLTPKREIRDKSMFADCSFFDLFINHKTQWGAPIPSTFQAFFKDILRLMVPEGETLILNIIDPYEGYFEEDQFINDFLEPHGHLYFFVEKEINGKKLPTLFFECPVERVDILRDVAFPGTVIDVDGFVVEKSKVSLFPRWAAEGNTDVMFRDLLRNVYFAFGLWGDHNGMLIVTDKLNTPGAEELLRGSQLERQIKQYVHNWS